MTRCITPAVSGSVPFANRGLRSLGVCVLVVLLCPVDTKRLPTGIHPPGTMNWSRQKVDRGFGATTGSTPTGSSNGAGKSTTRRPESASRRSRLGAAGYDAPGPSPAGGSGAKSECGLYRVFMHRVVASIIPLPLSIPRRASLHSIEGERDPTRQDYERTNVGVRTHVVSFV